MDYFGVFVVICCVLPVVFGINDNENRLKENLVPRGEELEYVLRLFKHARDLRQDLDFYTNFDIISSKMYQAMLRKSPGNKTKDFKCETKCSSEDNCVQVCAPPRSHRSTKSGCLICFDDGNCVDMCDSGIHPLLSDQVSPQCVCS